MGAVACYTGLILWRLFCQLDSDRYPIKTYGDIAERIFGTQFRHFCNALQTLQLVINVSFSLIHLTHSNFRRCSRIMKQVGTICLSNAQSVEQIANNHKFCFSVAILMWALVGMVIGQIRTLKQYGWLANS